MIWIKFCIDIRLSTLPPDLHLLSCDTLACSYPRQTLWLNPTYNYRCDTKKCAEAENVKKFGDYGGVHNSILNRAVEWLESCTPPNFSFDKGIFYRDQCSHLFVKTSRERVNTKRDMVRTSPSIPLTYREICNAVQVQALWGIPQALYIVTNNNVSKRLMVWKDH